VLARLDRRSRFPIVVGNDGRRRLRTGPGMTKVWVQESQLVINKVILVRQHEDLMHCAIMG